MRQPKLVVLAVFILFIGISAYLRIALPFNSIFTDVGIKFSSNDAYFQMRMTEIISTHFPQIPYFDPFFIYPDGRVVGGMIFFDWLLAGIIWLVSFGNPTPQIIDIVGVYYPAILGILTIIPVYFIGKNLFGRVAGLIASGLVAILPGEFLGRSLLGSTDQHVMETLLSTVTLMFLILAIKTESQKFAIYSILSGLFLGLYLITWTGAPLFVLIITIWFVVQFVINHMKRIESERLMLNSFIIYVVALAIYTRAIIPPEFTVAMIAITAMPFILYGLSRLMKRLKPFYYPIVLCGVVVITLLTFRFAKPELFDFMLSNFSIFNPQGASAQTTLETQPFFELGGQFTNKIAWGNFTTSLFIAPLSLSVLVILYIRGKFSRPEWLLFFVWTAVLILATIAQRRFAYYLVVNMALLVSYLSWQLIKLCAKKYKKKKVIANKINYVGVIVAIVIILGVVFAPNINASNITATQTAFSPSDAWQSSLLWMKDNTPEPLGNPQAYYEMVKPDNLTPEWKYEYPETAYGVTAWWDYGYWITRIAHRIPSANPSQNPIPIKQVANLFLSQDDATAQKIIKELKSQYVILDDQTVTGKFYALVTWVGGNPEDYMEIYYISDNAKSQSVRPIRLFYSAYYQSLSVRLYNFDGKPVSTAHPIVITYDYRLIGNQTSIKLITESREFVSYQDAIAYANAAKYRKVVGRNEFTSCVPLDKVDDYQLVYNSTEKINGQSEVKIFQHK